MEQRQQRKLDHLRQALALSDGPQRNGFDDVHLVPNALPGLDVSSIDPGCRFLGKGLRLPLLINAITGGTAAVTLINRALARVAREAGVALAVGSQAAALRDNSLWETYRVARRENPDGVILANINANLSVQGAIRAVEELEADGLQVHLNVAQELMMAEGDRAFSAWAENIGRIVEASPVPVIVKEVGCGVSAEVAARLLALGVRYIDTGGAGGTNFIAIERQRREAQALIDDPVDDPAEWLTCSDADSLVAWGMPTAVSLAEVVWATRRFERERVARRVDDNGISVIASGGVRGGFEMAKALAMGAAMVGVAGEMLRYLVSPDLRMHEHGERAVLAYIGRLERACRLAMVLTGSTTTTALAHCPYVITGLTGEWLKQRGIV